MELRVEGLCKSYGGMAVLQNVSFAAGNGVLEITAPSGTGKTTLLRILTGLERPDSGRITGTEGRRWAAVFQEDRLLEHLDAAGNLRFALGTLPEGTGDLLARLGLDLGDRKAVRNYSGGMKRRLALARALLAEWDLLALDEPFTGLDPENAARCRDLIAGAASERIVLLAGHGSGGGFPVFRLTGQEGS